MDVSLDVDEGVGRDVRIDVEGPTGGEGLLHGSARGREQGANEVGGGLVVDAPGERGGPAGKEPHIGSERPGQEGGVLVRRLRGRRTEGRREGTEGQMKMEIAAGHEAPRTPPGAASKRQVVVLRAAARRGRLVPPAAGLPGSSTPAHRFIVPSSSRPHDLR